MNHPDYTLFYVTDPLASQQFYDRLFQITPVEASPTFVLYVLKSGLKFGLWSRQTVQPASSPGTGSMEIAIRVEDQAVVALLYREWQDQAVTFLQAPTVMDFGVSIVATDPDGHRIRVFCPAETEQN